MRLELYYLQYAMDEISRAGQGDTVRLLPLQRQFSVPRSTHYAAIRLLINMKFIVRAGADTYRLDPFFIHTMYKIIKKEGYPYE